MAASLPPSWSFLLSGERWGPPETCAAGRGDWNWGCVRLPVWGYHGETAPGPAQGAPPVPTAHSRCTTTGGRADPPVDKLGAQGPGEA